MSRLTRKQVREAVARAVVESVGTEDLDPSKFQWGEKSIDHVLGFSSVCAVGATTELERELGIELGQNVFAEGDRIRTLDEVVDALMAAAGVMS